MPLIDTPYDQKLDRLRERIKRPGEQPKAARKFQRTRARQYLYQERHRPTTPPAYSSQYETTVGKLNRDLSFSQADITGRQLATEQQYGFNDQSSPFSRAKMLQRGFEQRALGTTNSMAARGQLYSGALSNMQAGNRFAYEQDLDSALREYQADTSDLARQSLAAQSAYDEGITAAEAARLEAGLQDRPEANESPPTPGYVRRFLRQRRRRQRNR